jgi:membrane fusion protein, multidrug efflux system
LCAMELKIWLIIAAIGISLLGAVGYSAVNHLIKTNPTIARKVNGPMPVQVAAAEARDLTEIVGANGQVQPITLVNITAKPPVHVDASPRVAKVAVDLGDLVSPGQKLLQFDPDLLNAALITAQTAIDQAAGELAASQLQVQRIKAIYEQGLLAKVELEKAQLVMAEANTKFQTAKERRLQAKKDLQNATMTSPVLGIVMERLINPGETPKANQPLLTIGRIDHVLIETKIAEERAGDIRPQQLATITFNAFPNDALKGKVVKIKPITDPETRTFMVYVKVANPERKLKPGMTGFVRIKKTHHVLAVPSIALINPTGVQDSSLFVVEHSSLARLRKVKIGLVAEGMTQVLDGLTEGDQVVVVGQLYLRDGDHVRIGDEFDELKSNVVQDPHPSSIRVQKPY